MTTEQNLVGRTLIMSGGSRGIGLAIGIAAARRGANVVLLAKTDKPDPRLPGTVHTAAAEIEAAGGQALAVVGDVRDEESVDRAVTAGVERFGGIDVCVNNASAIALGSTEGLPVKRFDLMTSIQLRGTYLLTRACLPHLREGTNPHVLSLSPPLNLAPKWLGACPAYMLAKYGMSLLTLGWAAEYAEHGVAANCLWPETMIATAAVQNLLGGDEAMRKSRTPDIVADAAIEIVGRPSRECTGNTFIDVDVLREAGVTDLAPHDRRGHGRSTQTWAGNDMDTYADDLAARLDELDLADAVLVGHSTGGGEVTRYLGRYGTDRVSRAVLLGSVTPLLLHTLDNPEGKPLQEFDGIRAGVAADRAQFFWEFTELFYGLNRPDATASEGRRKEFWLQSMQAGLKNVLDCVAAFSETDLTGDLERIDIPVLVAHGEDDQLVPIQLAKKTAAILKDATLKVYPGAPHGLHGAYEQAFNADLLTFISTGR